MANLCFLHLGVKKDNSQILVRLTKFFKKLKATIYNISDIEGMELPTAFDDSSVVQL